MLEVILMIFLCRGMGRLLRSKDHKPLLFQILLVIAYDQIVAEAQTPAKAKAIAAIRTRLIIFFITS